MPHATLPPLQAFLIEQPQSDGKGPPTTDFVGNRTECALLMMARSWGQDYRELRELHHSKIVGGYWTWGWWAGLHCWWPGAGVSLVCCGWIGDRQELRKEWRKAGGSLTRRVVFFCCPASFAEGGQTPCSGNPTSPSPPGAFLTCKESQHYNHPLLTSLPPSPPKPCPTFRGLQFFLRA